MGLFKRVEYNNTNCNKKKLDKPKQNLNFSYKLESGSLFIMGGCSQKYFTHEIPVADTDKLRYSLTFREFIQWKSHTIFNYNIWNLSVFLYVFNPFHILHVTFSNKLWNQQKYYRQLQQNQKCQ